MVFTPITKIRHSMITLKVKMESENEITELKSFFNAYIAASTVLCIMSIILIVVTNVLVIWKYARRSMLNTGIRNSMIISMAVGDIVLALFPLVFNAVSMFQEDPILADNCILKTAKILYMESLIHLVFGMVLINLWFELVGRDTQTTLKRPRPSEMLWKNCCPWLVGLAFMVPFLLTFIIFSNTDDDFCDTFYKFEVKYSLFVVCPSALALISSIVIMVKCTDKDLATLRIIITPKQEEVEMTRIEQREAIPMARQETQTEESISLANQEEQQAFLADRYVQTPEHLELFHQPPAQNVDIGSRDIVIDYDPKTSWRKERIRLLLMTLAFIAMVMPYGSYIISCRDGIYGNDYLIYFPVSASLMWLMVARSWVTPIILLAFRT